MATKVCALCEEIFTDYDIRNWEWRGIVYSKNPFVCPECYEEFLRVTRESDVKRIRLSDHRKRLNGECSTH